MATTRRSTSTSRARLVVGAAVLVAAVAGAIVVTAGPAESAASAGIVNLSFTPIPVAAGGTYTVSAAVLYDCNVSSGMSTCLSKAPTLTASSITASGGGSTCSPTGFSSTTKGTDGAGNTTWTYSFSCILTAPAANASYTVTVSGGGSSVTGTASATHDLSGF